jgi:RNA polymerase-binding transcription factor DksA
MLRDMPAPHRDVTHGTSRVRPGVLAALEHERRRTSDRLEALTHDHAGMVEASRDSNADDEHDPEGATIAFERSQVASLVTQAREHLVEVAAAEQRLRDGTYGRCTTCGRAIDEERLLARPVARTCVDCARRGVSRG